MAGAVGTLRLLIMAVLVVGCTATAQPQYHAAVGDIQSEEGRALQAVDEDRQRYGIRASIPEREEDVRRRCTLGNV